MRKTVAELRKERNWTQFVLAGKAGVSMSTVTSVESGRHGPRLEIAQKIATAFDVSVDDIEWITKDERSPKAEPTAA